MLRVRSLATLVSLCILSVAPCAGAAPGVVKVFPGEYLVEPETIPPVALAARASDAGFRVLREFKHTGQRLLRVNGMRAESTASRGARRAVDFDEAQSLCPLLIKRRIAKSCSPNYEVTASRTPNDPQFSSMWGLSRIAAPAAWELSTGTEQVVVAVIDTGIDYRHEDLAANVWSNPAEIPGNHLDDDHNGYIDDIHGISTIDDGGDPFDDNGHGTHVSGTIGALGNNARGVVGINWNVRIVAIKFLDSYGSGSLSDAVEGIEYMISLKQAGVNLRVSNNSWGGGGFSPSLEQAIARARDAGIIFVAAAGNESSNTDEYPSYPSNYDVDNVVSVAATGSGDTLASFSNYGSQSVDIAAPGHDILSTVPGGYASLSGTSMATPHVSGALALLLSIHPEFTVKEALDALYESGEPLSALSGLTRTGRQINLERLMTGVRVPLAPVAPPPEPCNYQIAEESFAAPDDLQSELIMGGDEAYYRLDLPFSFPFHHGTTSRVWVSTNGVVYTGSAPSLADYRNRETAPGNSIAALHTDLIAVGAPYGVKAAADGSHAVIHWIMQPYSAQPQGRVDVWLTLHANGRIDQGATFSDSVTLGLVRTNATVGLRGATPASAFTYAYNSAKISNRMAVSFTPFCTGKPSVPQASVASLSLHGVSGGRKTRFVRAGSAIELSIRGSGTGALPLGIAFKGRRCRESAEVTLSRGRATLRALLPRRSAWFSALRMYVGAQSSDPVRVYSTRQQRRAIGRLTVDGFSRLCRSIRTSLSQ